MAGAISPREQGTQEQEAIARFLAAPTPETYAALFRGWSPKMVGYFRARGCDAPLAEDLTQDVMLAVFRQAKQLRDPALFRSWLFQIARNALLQHRRTQMRRIATVELVDVAAPTADPLAAAAFAQTIASLPEDERELMMLRYVEELAYNEIAAVLEMPMGTVQWKIFQARKKLAALFGAVREVLPGGNHAT
jgi:RNA polymerase sigma-70 factor (ECF subfamily)